MGNSREGVCCFLTKLGLGKAKENWYDIFLLMQDYFKFYILLNSTPPLFFDLLTDTSWVGFSRGYSWWPYPKSWKKIFKMRHMTTFISNCEGYCPYLIIMSTFLDSVKYSESNRHLGTSHIPILQQWQKKKTISSFLGISLPRKEGIKISWLQILKERKVVIPAVQWTDMNSICGVNGDLVKSSNSVIHIEFTEHK